MPQSLIPRQPVPAPDALQLSDARAWSLHIESGRGLTSTGVEEAAHGEA